MTQQYQLAYIYAAFRALAGSPPTLPDPQCVLGQPTESQLASIYCAVLAWTNS
jgi:hypothetical protein